MSKSVTEGQPLHDRTHVWDRGQSDSQKQRGSGRVVARGWGWGQVGSHYTKVTKRQLCKMIKSSIAHF